MTGSHCRMNSPRFLQIKNTTSGGHNENPAYGVPATSRGTQPRYYRPRLTFPMHCSDLYMGGRPPAPPPLGAPTALPEIFSLCGAFLGIISQSALNRFLANLFEKMHRDQWCLSAFWLPLPGFPASGILHSIHQELDHFDTFAGLAG